MPEYATIRFRAKRLSDITRWNADKSFTHGLAAYNVPALTSSHVITPRTEQHIHHNLRFNNRPVDSSNRWQESLLRAHGLDAYRIFEGDDTTHPDIVTITPIKNGFMADITLRIDLKRKESN